MEGEGGSSSNGLTTAGPHVNICQELTGTVVQELDYQITRQKYLTARQPTKVCSGGQAPQTVIAT